jgi:hypothetical protein
MQAECAAAHSACIAGRQQLFFTAGGWSAAFLAFSVRTRPDEPCTRWKTLGPWRVCVERLHSPSASAHSAPP